jgi:murein DD-endopeptidase MepM/ murein hydrolase activator NlpD
MRAAWLVIGLAWGACAAAETLYRLPWADGLSFLITQSPGSPITTHFTKATLHAVDFSMPEGVPIVAARGGVVEALMERHDPAADGEPLTWEGNFVRVRHGDGTAAIYAHLRFRGVAVSVGDTVATGQLLGYSGASGDVEEPHLHFGVVRTETNSAGWREDISVPVRFYVGTPPAPFPPRPALIVKADYSAGAAAPVPPSRTPLVPRKRPFLGPGEEPRAWGILGLWLAAGAAGIAWYWWFFARD